MVNERRSWIAAKGSTHCVFSKASYPGARAERCRSSFETTLATIPRMEPNYVLQRTPGTFLVSSELRGPAPLNTALDPVMPPSAPRFPWLMLVRGPGIVVAAAILVLVLGRAFGRHPLDTLLSLAVSLGFALVALAQLYAIPRALWLIARNSSFRRLPFVAAPLSGVAFLALSHLLLSVVFTGRD